MSTGSTLDPPGALGTGAGVVVTGTAAGGGGGGGRHAAAAKATANTARASRAREKRERRERHRTMPPIQHMCGATVEGSPFSAANPFRDTFKARRGPGRTPR